MTIDAGATVVAAERFAMSTSVPPPAAPPASDPAAAHDAAAPADARDLDLEEDVAPNLGGEDQMQDA